MRTNHAKTKDIKIIGFDWDGTIVDSMGAKAKSFANSIIELWPSLKNNRKKIEKIYFETRGTFRFNQLDLVDQIFHLTNLNFKKRKEWSDLFTATYLDKKMPLFNDSLATLGELRKRGYVLFLSSSVPHPDLVETLKLYPAKKYFKYILGTKRRRTFKKGLPHLKFISEKSKCPIAEMAFVGDGAPDVISAKGEIGRAHV
jgi:phosphoglycolate phosphatase-like HAD superfamily hydrolase